MPELHCFQLLNNFTGSPKVLADVVRAARRQGWPVHLYVNAGGNGFLTGLDATYHYFPYRRSANKVVTLFAYLGSQIALFGSLMRQPKAGAVFYVNTLLPFGAALAGRVRGMTVIYHLHELSIRPRMLKAFLRFVVLHTAARVLYVSRYLEETEGVPGVDGRCIYNTLPSEFWERARNHSYIPLRKGRFCVLMIASLRNYKGVPELVRIATSLLDVPCISFSLLVSASTAELDSYFRGQALPINLALHAESTDTHPFFQGASLLLNLSRPGEWVETFGLTILEAMAYGIPAIVPPVGGPLELISDGLEGYAIRGDDTAAVAAEIRRLANDPETCQRLSEAARKKAGKFSLDSFEVSILDALHG